MLSRVLRVRFGHGPTLVGVGWTGLAWVWLAAILSVPLWVSPLDRAAEREAPRAAPYETTGWAIPVPRAVAAVYAIGARLCHQQPDRSFHWRGVQAPVCGRCLGIYFALAVGLLAGWFVRPRTFATARTARPIVTFAAAPTIVSLVVERLVGADPGNLLRAISAVPLGLMVGWLLILALTRSRPSTNGGLPSLPQRAL